MSELMNAMANAATITPPSTDLPALTFDVVRHRGHWRVLHVGKHSDPHPNQKAAIDSAMRTALERRADGRTVIVRLNRTDGQVFDLTDTLQPA